MMKLSERKRQEIEEAVRKYFEKTGYLTEPEIISGEHLVFSLTGGNPVYSTMKGQTIEGLRHLGRVGMLTLNFEEVPDSLLSVPIKNRQRLRLGMVSIGGKDYGFAHYVTVDEEPLCYYLPRTDTIMSPVENIETIEKLLEKVDNS